MQPHPFRSSPAAPISLDARRLPRVEHLLRLEYAVVPATDVASAREEVARSGQIFRYPNRTARTAHLEAPDRTAQVSEVADRLERIEAKLDRLLEQLGMAAPAENPQRLLLNVSLSANAARFRDVLGACSVGDTVRVVIELPLRPTVEVLVLGVVQQLIDSDARTGASGVRDIVVEFETMTDSSRRALERYCRRLASSDA
jgi:hypothetical protein